MVIFPVTPVTWSVGTVVSYLTLYTSYSKAQKTLVADNLLDVLFVRKGLDNALVQWNKVISLAGITTLALGFVPGAEQVCTDPKRLVAISVGMLSVHSAYSTWRFYGSPKIPVLSSFLGLFSDLFSEDNKAKTAFKKKASILCGAAAIGILNAMLNGYVKPTTRMSFSVLGLSTAHYFLMEQNFKGELKIRPYGYLGIIAPLAALGFLAPLLAK